MTARFDPFAGAAPRWRTIPAHRPFLEDLAAGVLAWLGDAPPERLTEAVILVPNRRAARDFAQALGRISGDRPVLLPQVRPLGDLEEDEPPFAPGDLGLDLPPAIPPLRRRFELARMIVEEFDPSFGPLRALEMADALGGFLDACRLEEVEDLSRLQNLVEGDLAEHWKQAADFLELAVAAWPERLEALGFIDGAERRVRLLRLLAERWTANPPQGPVIAAGSTGTAPAAAAVLAAIAAAPQGCVVVPGLDAELSDEVWAQIDWQHPQHALKRLLVAVEAAREDVGPWFTPVDARRGRARQRLLNEALRPAEATDDWREEIQRLRIAAAGTEDALDPVAEGLEGLSLVTLRNEEEAASAIALMMRETLETPGRTCALVTPDLDLGRRVRARLERWGVVPDSSSGDPLSRTSAGMLVDLCARFIADPLAPQVQLGLLKHPLVRIELEDGRFLDAREALERYGLRGPRPRDWAALRRRLLQAAEPRGDNPPSEHKLARLASARALADRLEDLAAQARAPFSPDASAGEAASGLARLVETLAGQAAWAGLDGEAAAGLLAELIEAGAALGRVDRAAFQALVAALLSEQTVRTGGATHPRLRILGAIEARLVRADRMILAGLEEGVWPAPAPLDPFLSRPMRARLGLPPPERRLGQTAQDFVQAACADETVLVHLERRGGQPTVRSRWLWRLQMLLTGAGVEPPVAEAPAGWARALDAPPPGRPAFAPRPQPRPPVARRPRKLPVTRVERWVRDPYAVYAREVLGLRELDRPGASAEALARGNAVHKAIERMTVAWPDVLPDDCADQLEALLLEELGAHGFEAAAMAREAPLARNCARWLAAFEARRRARGVRLLVEQEGEMTIQGPAGPFILTAKADRIEIAGDGAAVLDFKTGRFPKRPEVLAGFSPQLTLTGAILLAGGFPAAREVAGLTELAYVRVVGRKEPGELCDVSQPSAKYPEPADADGMAEQALDGLMKRVALFDDPATPYVSWAAPQFMGTFGGSYDRLARVWEWHVVGGDPEEASE